MFHCFGKLFVPRIVVTVAANVNDLNLFTLCGSPSDRCFAVITINSGVKVRRNAEVAALRSGAGWAAGSRVKIINNGKVYGQGGIGGQGAGPSVVSTAGTAGGDAIYLDCDVDIDNTNGLIFGGGGGGHGGEHDAIYDLAAGGGGGGGQGDAGGFGGAGGVGASSGTSGSESASGAGGAGASYGGRNGQTGANGGAWGNQGAGNGAAGGYAVRLNGYEVHWVAGNNSYQVKGSVA